MKILIVRLGALGDLVHAVPAAAALRAAFPASRIDWLVDVRHRAFLELVSGVDRIITLAARSARAWIDVARTLREVRYDVAFDLQGLMKSAVLARASGATRVAGFSIWHLREKAAWPFYSETSDVASAGREPSESRHVIFKNLRLLKIVGVESQTVAFPLVGIDSPIARQVREGAKGAPFALINPGAAWPNKRWPAERFGEVAAFLRDVHRMPSFVVWGPGEEQIARSVVESSEGAARLAPPTAIADLLALARAASLVVSGDTGPLHLAAAVGTPVVAIFGPTDPRRNGPWSETDQVVSRYETCSCQYERRCRRPVERVSGTETEWCLRDVTASEVTAAIQHRLHAASESRQTRV